MCSLLEGLAVPLILCNQSKQKNSRSELLLLIAPRSGGGGVEGLGGLGERKKGSPLPLIPIPRGTKVQPEIIKKQKTYILT